MKQTIDETWMVVYRSPITRKITYNFSIPNLRNSFYFDFYLSSDSILVQTSLTTYYFDKLILSLKLEEVIP